MKGCFVMIEYRSKEWNEEMRLFAKDGAARAKEILKRDLSESFVSTTMEKPISHTNEERLRYYRTHGLDNCDDYPGGDNQFEQDVLSGRYHDNLSTDRLPSREDAYIVDKMNDGTFKFSVDFEEYFGHPQVMLAYHENCGRNHFSIMRNYPGGPMQLHEDVMSGEYARRR